MAMLLCVAMIGSSQNLRIINNTASPIMVHDAILTNVTCSSSVTISVNTGLTSGSLVNVMHPGAPYVGFEWSTFSVTDGMWGCVCKPVNPSYTGCFTNVLGCGVTSVNWAVIGTFLVVTLT